MKTSPFFSANKYRRECTETGRRGRRPLPALINCLLWCRYRRRSFHGSPRTSTPTIINFPLKSFEKGCGGKLFQKFSPALIPPQLPNKIRSFGFFRFGKSVFFLTESDATHKEYHIICECTHSLHTFAVELDLTGQSAVCDIPILA